MVYRQIWQREYIYEQVGHVNVSAVIVVEADIKRGIAPVDVATYTLRLIWKQAGAELGQAQLKLKSLTTWNI